MGTSDQFLATEQPHMKSSTLYICIMFLNPLCLFKHDPHDRSGLHEERKISRNDGLASWVSKPLSTHNAEESSGTNVWKDVGASTAPAVLEKQNFRSAVFDVDMTKPVNPCRSSWKAIKGRKKLLLSQTSTEARPQRLKPKFRHNENKRKIAEEVQSNNVGAQPVPHTNLNAELGEFGDLFTSNFPTRLQRRPCLFAGWTLMTRSWNALSFRAFVIKLPNSTVAPIPSVW